ncbi:MAG: hypothetical protein II940_01335 [Methanosarcinaceae archaeon]|nr:hypothetical protein [Methanosarcinaceae archaeon]
MEGLKFLLNTAIQSIVSNTHYSYLTGKVSFRKPLSDWIAASFNSRFLTEYLRKNKAEKQSRKTKQKNKAEKQSRKTKQKKRQENKAGKIRSGKRQSVRKILISLRYFSEPLDPDNGKT